MLEGCGSLGCFQLTSGPIKSWSKYTPFTSVQTLVYQRTRIAKHRTVLSRSKYCRNWELNQRSIIQKWMLVSLYIFVLTCKAQEQFDFSQTNVPPPPVYEYFHGYRCIRYSRFYTLNRWPTRPEKPVQAWYLYAHSISWRLLEKSAVYISK